jgi:serine/threonine-protein phosphatase PGAM5
MSIMSWSRLSKLSTVAIVSVGGGSLLCSIFPNELKLKTVHNATSFTQSGSPEWDYNWDHRAPSKVVKRDALTSEAKLNVGQATRNVILIRHGQYNLRGQTDLERYLSELGRKQAKRTGERLNELEIPFDDVVISTMTRAQETGNIIVDHLSKAQRQNLKIINEPLIEEGAPVEPSKVFLSFCHTVL